MLRTEVKEPHRTGNVTTSALLHLELLQTGTFGCAIWRSAGRSYKQTTGACLKSPTSHPIILEDHHHDIITTHVLTSSNTHTKTLVSMLLCSFCQEAIIWTESDITRNRTRSCPGSTSSLGLGTLPIHNSPRTTTAPTPCFRSPWPQVYHIPYKK
jgi:hypothetical protein